MANYKSVAVTAIDSGLVRKSQYRGNVQAIPVSYTVPSGGLTASDTVEVTAVLPQNAVLVGYDLYQDQLGNTLSFGYTGAATGLVNGADTSSAGRLQMVVAPVDVGGKKLYFTVGTAWTAAKKLTGVLFIVTDE